MRDADKLELLKLNLDRTGNVRDQQLQHYLKVAADKIAEMGITLTDSAGDAELQIAYAAHKFRSRANPDAELPKDLSWDLKNRLFAEKGAVGE